MFKYADDFRPGMLIKKHIVWRKPKILICNVCYLYRNICQKNVLRSFLMFLEGIERDQWHGMG